MCSDPRRGTHRDLAAAYDNYLDHSHPYTRGEYASCGRWIGEPPTRTATERNVEHPPNDPLLDLVRSVPDRCDHCRVAIAAPATRAG